jgi:S-adenosylmethionine uptake transporter
MTAYVASVAAMRVGELGFVAPFRYMSLLVSILLGALVFGTFPDGVTLLGAGIVVGTGLFTLVQGRGRARPEDEAPPGA